jgi:hypothetical protein
MDKKSRLVGGCGLVARPTIAIGFRVHSGWAMMVAVAGSPLRPVIVGRQRLHIGDIAQPYHRAQELGLARADEFLSECREAAYGIASSALQAAIKGMGGDRVRECAVLTGSGRLAPTLEATLNSHAAIHTAEGEFFREIVIHAAESCGLPVRRIKEKELFEAAAREFRIPVADLHRGLNDLSKITGPPWQQDHKFAALAAWLVL